MSPEDVALAVFVALPVLLGFAALAFFRRLRASPPVRAWPTLLAGNLLVLALLLSFAMLAGECWFRFLYDGTDSFDATRASARWFARHHRKNSDGFRDHVEYGLGRVPAGKRRVTFVGDSFTAGHGVPDVTDRFANRLRAARPQWDVHVFAVNGWDTGGEVTWVTKQLPAYTKGGYAFDEVVLVYNLNDIADILPEIGEMQKRLGKAHEKGLLARSSYLFDMLRFLWIVSTDDEIRGYFPKVELAYTGPVWEAQRARLRALREFVTSRGGRLSVVTWPMLHELGADYPFRQAHESLGAFWRSEGVAHLDLLTVFEDRSSSDLVVGRLDAHPNEVAHRIAAEAIAPWLDAEMTTAK